MNADENFELLRKQHSKLHGLYPTGITRQAMEDYVITGSVMWVIASIIMKFVTGIALKGNCECTYTLHSATVH